MLKKPQSVLGRASFVSLSVDEITIVHNQSWISIPTYVMHAWILVATLTLALQEFMIFLNWKNKPKVTYLHICQVFITRQCFLYFIMCCWNPSQCEKVPNFSCLKGLSHGVDLEFHLSCFKKTHFQIT
jgi:hypothetical protein